MTSTLMPAPTQSARKNTMPAADALPRTATMLTVLVLLLVPVATLVGLFVPGFYRDTAWMIPQAQGQDLITLVVAEPLLLGFLLASWRGHFSARLMWMGALSYLLYTYAMYSYTAYFNALFLVYVALFSATVFALLDLMLHLNIASVRAAIRPTAPVRAIRAVAVFLGLVGVLFLVAWLGQIVPAILRGTVPDAIVLAKTPTSAVHVQDLGFVIPLLFVAAVWLWQRRVWGFVLGATLLVLADIMLIALLAMEVYSARAGIAGALDMFPVFAVLTVASIGFTALCFAQFRHVVPHIPGTGPSTNTANAAWLADAVPLDGETQRSREVMGASSER